MKYGFGLPFRLLSGFNLVFEYFERTVTSDVSQEFFHVFSMKKYFKNCYTLLKYYHVTWSLISSWLDGEFSSSTNETSILIQFSVQLFFPSNEFSINVFVQIRIKVEQCFIHTLVFDYIWALPLNYRAYF